MLSCLQYTRLLRMGNFFTRTVLSIPMVLDERVRVKRFPPSAPLSWYAGAPTPENLMLGFLRGLLPVLLGLSPEGWNDVSDSYR